MFTSMGVFALVLAGAMAGLWTPDLDRNFLEKKYATPNSHFVVVQGLRIHYQDTGPKDAPVLLLLHGFGSSLQTWDVWAHTLESKFRVIRLDLPGFGLTGPSPDQKYADLDDVQAIARFVDHLGLTELSLLGHSMGGKIAWNFAAAYPERVKRLVLMAPDGYSNPEEFGFKPYAMPSFMSVIKYCLPKFMVKKSIEPAFFDAQELQEDLLNRYFDMLRAPGVRQAIIDRANQTINTDPAERLKRITAPTLLLWGQADQMIPSDNAKRYELVLPQYKTVVLPKQGHLMQEERPQEALLEVTQFLESAL